MDNMSVNVRRVLVALGVLVAVLVGAQVPEAEAMTPDVAERVLAMPVTSEADHPVDAGDRPVHLIERYCGSFACTERWSDGTAHVGYTDPMTGIGWGLWVTPGVDVQVWEDGSAHITWGCSLGSVGMDLVDPFGAFGTDGPGRCGTGMADGSVVYPLAW